MSNHSSFEPTRTPPPASGPPRPERGKFTRGSTMRHILVMSGSSGIGLMAVFLVDFADLYFLGLLGEIEVAAAIGYAGSVLFFTVALGVALSIAATALVSPALGAGKKPRARRRAINALIFAVGAASVLSLVLWLSVPVLLGWLGAEDRAFELASSYLRIVLVATPLLVVGMNCAALLRSVGDAKRAMYVTLSGAIINGLLDPLFIFALGLGVDGAAIASALARTTMALVGLYGVVLVHGLLAYPKPSRFWPDALTIAGVAAPVALTNLATPIANAYVTSSMAPFGVSAVAGWAVLSRLIPVSFAGIFALSGAIGPVLGQNLGAREYARLRHAFLNGVIVVLIYALAVWAILASFHEYIAHAFNARGDAVRVIAFFCVWLSPGFGVLGLLFMSNAAFNNLGRPHYATILNWGRATLGTMLPVSIASQYFGPYGVLAGQVLGGMSFGIIAATACYLYICSLERAAHSAPAPEPAPAE
ncbi:MATE family efflux transporter [Dichotomicrobium thermohalophilum]|uniref:Putative MATE family efflux protein n=1 Tax=Dichotomicrobium thermohalophilum TaxID=933063 RepID=A0A397PJE0_9HYPH|nr:MATE family efflux transporter [Dichotomicrobium thermohalophilum]RIA47395.1 putative MATE family efflux protein [Dichotomicrobium thermohalophilum]